MSPCMFWKLTANCHYLSRMSAFDLWVRMTFSLQSLFHLPVFRRLVLNFTCPKEMLQGQATVSPAFSKELILNRNICEGLQTDYDPSQFDTDTHSDPHTYNVCNTTNCRHCTRLDTVGRITSKTTGKTYNTKKNVSCKGPFTLLRPGRGA